MSTEPAAAELHTGPTPADPTVAGARGVHGRSDLDRHADANAALVGPFRRALVFDSHTDV